MKKEGEVLKVGEGNLQTEKSFSDEKPCSEENRNKSGREPR